MAFPKKHAVLCWHSHLLAENRNTLLGHHSIINTWYSHDNVKTREFVSVGVKYVVVKEEILIHTCFMPGVPQKGYIHRSQGNLVFKA